MATNQTVWSRLEQGSVIKFLVAEKCKPCEIYRRMLNVYGKVCSSQKMFPNRLNCLKKVKIVFKMKTGQAGLHRLIHLKWSVVIGLLKIKGPITIDLLQSSRVIFLHNKSRPHLSARSVETISQFFGEQLPCLPYSPNLVTPPSELHLFSPSKNFKQWWSEEHKKEMLKTSVQRFLCWRFTKTYFFDRKNGDFIKKYSKNFFPGWNAKCFIVKFTYLLNDPQICMCKYILSYVC